jgi:hypothetical protein
MAKLLVLPATKRKDLHKWSDEDLEDEEVMENVAAKTLIILLLFPDGNQCCIISGGESFGE